MIMNTQLVQLFDYVFDKNKQTEKALKLDATELAIWFEKQCKQLKPNVYEDEVFEMALVTLSNVFYVDDFKHNRFETIKRNFNLFIKQEFHEEVIDKRNELKKILLAISDKLTPKWSLDVIENMINSFYYFFRKILIKNDDAIIERVNAAYIQLNKQEDLKTLKPEYFYVTVLNNLFLKEDKKEYIKIQSTVKENFLRLFENEYIDFNGNEKKKYVKRIVHIDNPLDFEKLRDEVDTISIEDAEENTKAVIRAYTNILKLGGLSAAERKILQCLIESLDFEGEQTYKEYINKAREVINESPSNTLQIIYRLRKRINLPENRELKSQLFGFKKVSDDLLALKFLEEMLHQKTETMRTEINLKAYRFSEEELLKMLELKSLFKNNGFEIERFPEVYYDDYDNYKKIFGPIEKVQDNTPDYLGVYRYEIENDNENYSSKEGIIVIFKNRIEKYDIEIQNSIRFIVLMHELGHWFMHNAVYNNDFWTEGYEIPRIKTKESFAQLVAYWMSDGNPEFEKALDLLTPKGTSPYNLYLELVSQSKSNILNKISYLREHYFLNDDISFLVLKCENEITNVEFWKEYFLNEKIEIKSNEQAKVYLTDIFMHFKLEDFKDIIKIENVLSVFFSGLSNKLYLGEEAPFKELKNQPTSKKFGI